MNLSAICNSLASALKRHNQLALVYKPFTQKSDYTCEINGWQLVLVCVCSLILPHTHMDTDTHTHTHRSMCLTDELNACGLNRVMCWGIDLCKRVLTYTRWLLYKHNTSFLISFYLPPQGWINLKIVLMTPKDSCSSLEPEWTQECFSFERR